VVRAIKKSNRATQPATAAAAATPAAEPAGTSQAGSSWWDNRSPHPQQPQSVHVGGNYIGSVSGNNTGQILAGTFEKELNFYNGPGGH